MKKAAFPRVFLFAIFALAASVFTHAQSNAKWYNSKTWLGGLKLKPHPSTNKDALATQYKARKADWDKAFAFLRDSNLATIKPGKYPINGDQVYATVTEGPEKEFDASQWESHKKYQDIQYIIRGKEKIGVASPEKLQVKTPYDPARDVANYTGDGKYYIAEPGTFFIFFPTDAHRPGIKVDGYDVVKKITIKVHVAD